MMVSSMIGPSLIKSFSFSHFIKDRLGQPVFCTGNVIFYE